MDDLSAAAQRGRRSKAAQEVIRERMFEKAREVIDSMGGIGANLENLGMEALIRLAGVPRSSVYRIWPYREDFIADLMVKMAAPGWYGTAAFDAATAQQAMQILADHHDLLSSEAGRRQLLHEAVRQAAKTNFDYISSSTDWRTYMALLVTAPATVDPQLRGRLARAIQESEEVFLGRMALFYEIMGALLGCELRPGLTYKQLAAAGAAVVEGLTFRRMLSQIEPQATSKAAEMVRDIVERPIEADGMALVPEWTLAAYGFMGVLSMFVDVLPQDRYVPPTPEAIASYMQVLQASFTDGE